MAFVCLFHINYVAVISREDLSIIGFVAHSKSKDKIVICRYTENLFPFFTFLREHEIFDYSQNYGAKAQRMSGQMHIFNCK